MPRRPGNEFSGTPQEYLSDIGIEHLMSWTAIYADEKTTKVFTSRNGDLLNGAYLPAEGLQVYLVFYRKNNKPYTLWIDGYDEYELIGRDGRVKGLYLTDKRWKKIQGLARVEREVGTR